MEAKKIYVAKRGFDLILSTLILLITSPLIIMVLVLIKLEQIMRGRFSDPLFYGETRMSYGRRFTLYKFNIFKYEQILEARARGEFIHTKQYEHNGGITPIGWVLKQIYMDEIPQFFNVLRGDLSIVGPRPVNLEVYATLQQRDITDKDRVPGGITGYYQSQKENTSAGSDDLDQQYADFYHSHFGLQVVLFDLKIIAKTLKVIVRAKGI